MLYKALIVGLLLVSGESMSQLTGDAQPKQASDAEKKALAQSFKIRGFEHRRFERYQQAIADLLKAKDLSPGDMNAEAYQVLGECYAELDDPKKAISAFSNSITKTKLTKGPENFWSEGKARSQLECRLLRRAQAYSVSGKVKDALIDADSIIELQHGDARKQYWPYEFRAQLEMSSEKYEKAVGDLSTAIQLSPIMPLYSQRAKAYEKLGDKRSAMRDRQHALETSKKDF